MSYILEEFAQEIQKEGKKRPSFYFRLAILIAIVIGFGVYVGDILFGKSSLDVLLDLQSQEEMLQISIEELKQKNALLQKEYFELIELDPDSKGF